MDTVETLWINDTTHICLIANIVNQSENEVEVKLAP